MAITKARDWRDKTEPELTAALAEKRRKLWEFRSQSDTREGADVKEGRTLRREIARIETILSERRRSGAAKA